MSDAGEASMTAVSTDDLQETVYAAFETVIGYRPSADTSVTDIMESLDVLELLIELEDAFEIDIVDDDDDESMAWWLTPGSIVEHVARKVG
jgi:acyl carrier protein